MTDQLEITLTRYSDGEISGMEIHSGEPDQCGHRRTVSISQQRNGSWLIQSNFCDFYESRLSRADASAVALSLAIEA